MSDLLVLVSGEAARRMKEGGQWGQITFRVSDPDNVGAVIAVSDGSNPVMPTPLHSTNHFLNAGHARGQHRWYRAAPELHLLWWHARNTGREVALEVFKEKVAGRWLSPSAGRNYVALTVATEAPAEYPDISIPEMVAWYVTPDAACPVAIDVVSAEHGFPQLAGHWPTTHLAESSIMLVGAGSIGGAAAHALASYGVGRLVLIDPDRLLSHNVVRHVSSAKHVGRLKVDAVKQELAEAWPATRVDTLPVDAIAAAHLIRPRLRHVDVVLCTADGVAARRVISHLARRARTDAVLACALQDGAIGEIIRLRPWSDHGCLTCHREALTARGAMDPEPASTWGTAPGPLIDR